MTRSQHQLGIIGLLGAGALFLALVGPAPSAPQTSAVETAAVVAVAETEPVPSPGDAADDAAIWVHPKDPSLSTIIGTDKDRGVAVYDLFGRQLQFLPDGKLNNVALRAGFPLAGRAVALVTAGNKVDGSIAIYRVNPRTRKLEDVAARKIVTVGAYGSCMYHSAKSDKYYYIVNSKSGRVEQWELFDNGAGRVDAKQVRSFEVGVTTEGCVADDELGHLFIALEEFGIRKYQAEPAAGAAYTVVDRTGPGGHLAADVEGLTLYRGPGGAGYLIASSQGSDNFVVYERAGDHDYVTTFAVDTGEGVDRVTHTDGITAVSTALGPRFPAGLLVVQDNHNGGGNQNFKLVSWQSVADLIRATRPTDVSAE
jgi:3-phytase